MPPSEPFCPVCCCWNIAVVSVYFMVLCTQCLAPLFLVATHQWGVLTGTRSFQGDTVWYFHGLGATVYAIQQRELYTRNLHIQAAPVLHMMFSLQVNNEYYSVGENCWVMSSVAPEGDVLKSKPRLYLTTGNSTGIYTWKFTGHGENSWGSRRSCADKWPHVMSLESASVRAEDLKFENWKKNNNNPHLRLVAPG